MRSNLLPIAKEGWNYILLSLVAFIVFMVLDFDYLQFLSFLALLFFAFVFRNPEREHMLYQENSVVSPVDGKVVSIEEIDSDDYAYRVDIETTFLDVSLLRAPMNSSLHDIKIQRGARLSPTSAISKEINENAQLVFKDTRSSNTLKVVHTLKQSFKGIDIEMSKNQNMLQGSRYGLMINGLTSIYLPQNFRLNVSSKSELRASETLLGYFMIEAKK